MGTTRQTTAAMPTRRSERRAHVRKRIAHTVKAYEERNDRYVGTIGDISEGGLMLVSSEAVEVHQRLVLLFRFELPNGKRCLLRLGVECMWNSDKTIMHDNVHNGFRIVEISKPDQRLLRELVESL